MQPCQRAANVIPNCRLLTGSMASWTFWLNLFSFVWTWVYFQNTPTLCRFNCKYLYSDNGTKLNSGFCSMKHKQIAPRIFCLIVIKANSNCYKLVFSVHGHLYLSCFFWVLFEAFATAPTTKKSIISLETSINGHYSLIRIVRDQHFDLVQSSLSACTLLKTL